MSGEVKRPVLNTGGDCRRRRSPPGRTSSPAGLRVPQSGLPPLLPGECLFVDDYPANLDAAGALGYLACGISRYAPPPSDGRRWVQDLGELMSLIDDLISGR